MWYIPLVSKLGNVTFGWLWSQYISWPCASISETNLYLYVRRIFSSGKPAMKCTSENWFPETPDKICGSSWPFMINDVLVEWCSWWPYNSLSTPFHLQIWAVDVYIYLPFRTSILILRWAGSEPWVSCVFSVRTHRHLVPIQISCKASRLGCFFQLGSHPVHFLIIFLRSSSPFAWYTLHSSHPTVSILALQVTRWTGDMSCTAASLLYYVWVCFDRDLGRTYWAPEV